MSARGEALSVRASKSKTSKPVSSFEFYAKFKVYSILNPAVGTRHQAFTSSKLQLNMSVSSSNFEFTLYGTVLNNFIIA